MTTRPNLSRRALALLVLSQVAAISYGAGEGGLALGAAVGCALLSLALGGCWYVRKDQRLLYGGAAAATGPLLVPLQLPIEVVERVIGLVAVLALVAALEYGHLVHRIERMEVGNEVEAVARAMSHRLSRTLALTGLGVAVVVSLTAVPGPWFGEAFARSVERSGPTGVLLVAGGLSTLIVALARVRLLWLDRGPSAEDR